MMFQLVSWLLMGIGGLLARLPDRALEGLAWVLGQTIYYLFWKRCRLLLASLAYAFPDYTEKRRKAIAKESCKRTVEMALVALILPFWNKKELEERFDFGPGIKLLEPLIEAGQALLILTPHFSMMEVLTLAPLFYAGKLPPMGVVYRPLNNRFLERFIKKTRERGGMRLLSRKAGLLEAIKLLKNKGIVAVLFDQNAGIHGLETLFLDRPVYATELPELLLSKTQARPVFLYMQRTGFMRGKLEGSLLGGKAASSEKDGARLCIVEANAALEQLLKTEDNLCADWLWLHKRWDMKRKWKERLSCKVKKTILPETLAFRGLKMLPRKRNVWIRLPNWLGDVVMVLPLLKALRKALPDAAISIIGKAHFECLFRETELQALDIGHRFIPLPPREGAYWPYFWKLRQERPELYLLFTNSFRGDLEAFLTGAPERFGIQKPKKSRFLLSHAWPQPPELDEASIHQTQLWHKFLGYFGLEEPLDLRPLALKAGESPSLASDAVQTIALICGTENSPEKRWPISHWESLIGLLQSHYPLSRIWLLGTAKDALLTQHLSNKHGVEDLAGKTTLTQLLYTLKSCKLVVGNDTGGIHLANMVGTPTIALYGPTQPLRTRPIYEGQPISILSENGSMESISPDTVFEAVQMALRRC